MVAAAQTIGLEGSLHMIVGFFSQVVWRFRSGKELPTDSLPCPELPTRESGRGKFLLVLFLVYVTNYSATARMHSQEISCKSKAAWHGICLTLDDLIWRGFKNG